MQYRNDLDLIKGIAIIGVILFHLGIVKTGYLGVDAFLVINGFLIIPALLRKIEQDKFSYIKFLKKRVLRLWPMIVIATILCMAIGYIGMLPDDYENLGAAVVASNLFSENILLYLTTGDYWHVSNDYNPLMHLWYVGIIFEFYLLFPLLAIVWHKFFGSFNRSTANCSRGGGRFYNLILLVTLFLLSFILYVSPYGAESQKFYFLHCRLFEFVLGGIVGYLTISTIFNNKQTLSKYAIYGSTFILLIVTIFHGLYSFNIDTLGTDIRKIGDNTEIFETGLILPKALLLIFTVFITAVLIHIGKNLHLSRIVLLEYCGKRSYSLFIWHQIIIAFYRYYPLAELI